MRRPPVTWNDVPTARRLCRLLLAAFFGTIFFFLLSSVVTNQREQGIRRAAWNISDVGLPSIQHLSAARTALQEMDSSLDDLTGGATSEQDPGELLQELQRSRAVANGEWQAYKALPAYPGEHDLQENTASAIGLVNRYYDEAQLQLQARNVRGARTIRNEQAAPAVERLGASLHALIDLNAVRAAEQSAKIAALRYSAKREGIALHWLSAIFASIAGLLLFRVVRRFARLMELRVTELEHFAGRVAHDIRSPLGAVGLALEAARRDPELGDKTRSRLGRATATVQRIGQLVDGLLVFAIGGAPPLQGAQANVHEVLSDVIEGMQPRAEEQDIELYADEVDERSVACTPGVLTSLLANLICNAVKYMGDASVRQVKVRACSVGSMVRIEVRDTGPGVPAELRQRVFDPYVRAASSGVSGFGLGLATVRRLVEAHGGSVGLEGNPSGGSLFWFQLPRAPDTTDSPGAVSCAVQSSRLGALVHR